MKKFLDEDFLLETGTARSLYHDVASKMPIIDFHCHLPPEDIAANKMFETITGIWLEGDHYKWRAMRAMGIDEDFITGKASDREKFEKWAYTVPYTMRNPLYHWTHLELQRYFGVTELLSPKTASVIFDECRLKLAEPELSVGGIHRKMNVEVVCTTDDPIDSLEHHEKLVQEGYHVGVYPTFRPDNVLKIGHTDVYIEYLEQLGAACDCEIKNFDDLMIALEKRVNYFDRFGCRLSDHGLDYLPASDVDLAKADKALKKALRGEPIDMPMVDHFRSATMFHLAEMYHKKGWTQQFHLGALRNTNDRLRNLLGADCGTDSIGDYRHARNMAVFFNRLDKKDALAKTIIYNLNPADNEVFAAMIGNFNDGSVAGKMQFGSGWWFLDQKDGMIKQMNALSNLGLLSRFVGMVTDSRSFMSYPRHEYFRRILCNLIGNDVERGELPNDLPWLGQLVGDICYRNAKEYFEFESRTIKSTK